jgi:hypothetical protein
MFGLLTIDPKMVHMLEINVGFLQFGEVGLERVKTVSNLINSVWVAWVWHH